MVIFSLGKLRKQKDIFTLGHKKEKLLGSAGWLV